MSFTHADTAVVQLTAGATSVAVTLSGAVGAGDLLVGYTGSPGFNNDTVTDTAGNTWQHGTTASFGTLIWCLAAKAAPGGITITVAGAGSGTRSLVADRFTPTGPVSLAATPVNAGVMSGTSGNCGSGAGTAGGLVYGAGRTGTASLTWTAGSSNGVAAAIGSQVGNGSGSGFSEYILSGAGGTESVTWSASSPVGAGSPAGQIVFVVTGYVPPPYPPGYLSPAAWQAPPYKLLPQTVTIAGSGGVVLPKPSLSGQGAVSPPAAFPAVQPMPPGLSSPAAWQYPRYPRLGQVVTISGSGGVTLPKPSLAGTGNVTLSVVLPASPLMPPGLNSPAAWQYPRYPRLGQTVTISGSGGVVLPKPSLAGQGAVTPPAALPASPLMPPGYLSPAAWQAPPYPRLSQVVTIAGAGGVVLPKPSLSGSGLVTVSGIARPPLLPPGLASPAAWQFPRYPRLPLIVTIQGSGGVTLPKPSLAGSSAAATTKTGSWWGLVSVLKHSRSEFESYVSRPPMACPNCGEPLTYAPATKAGSGIERYCKYDGFQFPRDWIAPQRPW